MLIDLRLTKEQGRALTIRELNACYERAGRKQLEEAFLTALAFNEPRRLQEMMASKAKANRVPQPITMEWVMAQPGVKIVPRKTNGNT